MPKHFKENGNDCKERRGRDEKWQESRMRRKASTEKGWSGENEEQRERTFTKVKDLWSRDRE